MGVILTFLPASSRLYTAVLSGIRRRIGTAFELQTIDYTVNAPTLKSLLDFWNPIGVIVIAAEGASSFSQKLIGKIPVVFVDRTPFTSGNWLDIRQNYAENGREAARELIHPDIRDYAFVGYHKQTSWSRERGDSFANAIRLQRRTFHRFDEPNTGNRAKRLEDWLVKLPKPVGIFTANDFTAHEVHVICTHNQIRIPEDVSLLGIDNIAEICESVRPPISSIMSDFDQSGWMAAELLFERISHPRLRKTSRFYPTLGIINRASTRKRQPGLPAAVLRGLDAIRARACGPLTVADVAAAMSCSQRMAEIRFRQSTGKTIKQLITEARLDRARILLRDRSLTLKEIATRCGYGTENAFRIAYTNRYGATLSSGRTTSRK